MARYGDNLSERGARQALVKAYKQACNLRLNELSSGNVSCRFKDGLLISPTGASDESITEDSVVFIDAAQRWGQEQKPSSEWQLHAAVYRDNPEANAVVHTHSDHCVAVACHGKPLPGFHYLVGLFGGPDVPCVRYSTFGSQQLAHDVAAALRDRNACLMSNHGMTCRAVDLDSAVKLAQRLEIMCRQYILSRALGEPACLSDADWSEFFAKIKEMRYGA
jgi:L-fuculose-phosphate aldolase